MATHITVPRLAGPASHEGLVVNLKAAGGRSISMHKLDQLVTDHLMKRR
jgi:hypothetical protein